MMVAGQGRIHMVAKILNRQMLTFQGCKLPEELVLGDA
jgi:hypothetical protein